MSDLISRQAALNAIEKTIKANSSIHYEMRYWEDGMNCAKNILEDLPSADAVSVVRCKDCEHWKKMTDRHGVCIHVNGVMSEIDFCSYGLRRGEGWKRLI